jgi:fumarate reductase subunit C
MRGWWWRNPYYLRYMIREGSAIFLVVYALVLLGGLYRLYQGEAQFNAWRAALERPWSMAFHCTALLLVCYHSVTWFAVMPKTAPQLPVSPRLITALGLAAAISVSVLLTGMLWWLAR